MPSSYRQLVNRLFAVRNRYDPESSREKLTLLKVLDAGRPRTAGELERLHRCLCFIQAFPDTIAHRRRARSMLRRFQDLVDTLPKAQLTRLDDTGIVGTRLYYAFSYEVAEWLARRESGTVTIDWDELESTDRLDELLEHLMQPAETDYFESGRVTTREWIELVKSAANQTDFDWLFNQLRQQRRLTRFWAQTYNAADVPLAWNLRDSNLSISRNTFRSGPVAVRASGLRGWVRSPKRAIREPLRSVTRLSPQLGARLIDVAMATMAARHRETYHFNYANAGEIYLIDVGEGVNVAVTGLQPEFRVLLECNFGHLILANGVPIGYGGTSLLFKQVNTGINILEEYRGSEAAFIWVQVMRVYHHLFGCNRFVANPYQFGGENTEALKTGAFWFYYRLGYRPVEPDIHDLAKREWTRIRAKPDYRSPLRTLKELTRCDMHLTLPGARQSEFFPEPWLDTCSQLATRQLAAQHCKTRDEAADRVVDSVVQDLGLRQLDRWTPAERRALRNLSPVVAAVKPATWSKDERRALRDLIRAKGGQYDLDFARHLRDHRRFRLTLSRICRAAERAADQ